MNMFIQFIIEPNVEICKIRIGGIVHYSAFLVQSDQKPLGNIFFKIDVFPYFAIIQWQRLCTNEWTCKCKKKKKGEIRFHFTNIDKFKSYCLVTEINRVVADDNNKKSPEFLRDFLHSLYIVLLI